MTGTGHGRPPRALAFAAVPLALLLAAAPAAPAAPYGNVVEAVMPRPDAGELTLTRLRVEMARRAGAARRPLGRLQVRRAGGRLPRGFSVAAVRARPRGRTVTVRLAAVRTGSAARAGRPLRVRVRIGGDHVVFRRATLATLPIAPGTRVPRPRDCRAMNAEASRWTPVRGLGSVELGGERFGARVAVGAAQQRACRRRLPAVPGAAAARFLRAVDPGFGGGFAGAVEGFYATWARNADGSATVCVYVRGVRGGTGEVTVAGTTQPFRLHDEFGVARTVATVAGDGDHPFTVRWRRQDGTVHTGGGAVTVRPGGAGGEDPPAPYAAAGACTPRR
jgi:hypothetical protein